MDFRTVLLPQPLPPITAKMLPRRTSKDRSRWMILGPKASVTSRSASKRDLVCRREEGIAMCQMPTTSASDREHRVHRDDADNPDDDRPGGGDPDIGGAPPGLQPDTTACQTDHDRESDRLGEAKHELVDRHSRRGSDAGNPRDVMFNIEMETTKPPSMPTRHP